MLVGRVERTIGPKSLGHVQRVTHEVKDGVFIQTGETIEHGKTTFKEVIEKDIITLKELSNLIIKMGRL